MGADKACTVCGFPLGFGVDTGPLDLGLTRDYQDGARNDFEIFMEEFTSLDTTCGPIPCPPVEEIEINAVIGPPPEPGQFAAEAAAFYGLTGGDFQSVSVMKDGTVERNDNGRITKGPPPIVAVFRTEEDHENFAYTMMGEPILRVGGRCDDGSHAGTAMCAYVIEELWAAGKTAVGDVLDVQTDAGLTITATVTETVRCASPEAMAFQVMPPYEWCNLVTLAVSR